jgi:UDP-2,3-diacylglucosamine hydrolase
MPTTLIIADLHLSPSEPKIVAKFYEFMDHIAPKATELILLGDIFERWLGDDDDSAFNQAIIQKLQQLHQQGVKLKFMHGNRDFGIGEHFAKQTGCELLPDTYVQTLGGVSTLLLHGDTLCTDDIAYQHYRQRMRSPDNIAKLLRLPLWVRRGIGAYLRLRSRWYQRFRGSTALSDVNQHAVRTALQQHHVIRMIHGHTHRPAMHFHYENEQVYQRWVLSDWHRLGNYLAIDDRGMLQLVYF